MQAATRCSRTRARPPVFVDLAGSGNTEAVVERLGHASSIGLDTPGTGLLQSADDGKGTVLRFAYGRAPAAAGERQRHALLSSLTVESSGYDAVTYSYGYQAPAVHSVG